MKSTMKKTVFTLLLVGALLSGCKPDMTVTDTWIGRWTGPEGTSLKISRDGNKDRYLVSIQSLDNLETYIARTVDSHLEFKRRGKKETIIAGDGQATGMKWLLDKKNCLVIQTSEGFCRD